MTTPTPTFTWSVTGLDVAPSVGPVENVVRAVNWACTYGVDGNLVQTQGKCYVGPPGPNYIPIGQINREAVLSWLDNELWKDTVEDILRARYEALNTLTPDAPKFVDQMPIIPAAVG